MPVGARLHDNPPFPVIYLDSEPFDMMTATFRDTAHVQNGI